MGFLNSAKNQVGRDLGKVVSNFVFGDKNVDKVLASPIPVSPNNICNLMDLMHSQVQINGWKPVPLSDDADKNRIYNKYTEACYSKFCQCLQRLQLNGANVDVID